MYYISASASVSHQATFQNPGFSESLKPLVLESVLETPPYKDFIDGALLRRMSKILRMSVACAKSCVNQMGTHQPHAIVVGTGLGCLHETEKFLNNVLTIEGLLPPTAFIQSTHNTIAGQISLSLVNHGYNMTHTQNALSFEYALQDALMLLNEESGSVLVGGADEAIDFLDEIQSELKLHLQVPLTSGASFFILSKDQTPQSKAAIVDVTVGGKTNDVEGAINSFLQDHELEVSDLDRIIYLAPLGMQMQDHHLWLGALGLDFDKCIDITPLSGLYATASSFGLHYAADLIAHDTQLNKILILNLLNPNGLGLTLVTSVEA